MNSKNYWLLKSEPNCYSIDDWKREGKTQWTGVRNYQARNFLTSMKVGDGVLFYHSGDERSIVGMGKVSLEATPDLTALDKKDDHYDPKATKDNPIWFGPVVSYGKTFKNELTLVQIKFDPRLEGIFLAKKGSRLSVQPVSRQHFEYIVSRGIGK